MGVLTDKFFSGASSGSEKRSAANATLVVGSTAEQPKIYQDLQLLPVVVQTPYPNSPDEMECLETFKRLVATDDTIINSGVDKDDEFLLAFIRGKRGDTDKALKILQNYVQVRENKYAKFFQNLSPRKFASMLQEPDRFCGLLRHTDREGRCVGVAQASLFNPRKHDVEAAIELFVISGMELLRTDNAPRNGLVLVIDASGFGLRHAREFTMSRIYMFLQIFLSSYPIKYKGFHILNNSYIFDTILTLIKTLIPKKLRERIHLHGNNYEGLHKHVPKEILPECFGGLLKSEDAYNHEFEDRILSKTEYYEKFSSNW